MSDKEALPEWAKVISPANKSKQALGNKVTDFQGFDTFDKPEYTLDVCMVSDEVTALCPVTSQPDWYTVRISYGPIKLCLESKSLKLYLHSLRNVGMFCEALSSKIASEIFAALSPEWVKVEIIQKARGGVSITASSYKEKNYDE